MSRVGRLGVAVLACSLCAVLASAPAASAQDVPPVLSEPQTTVSTRTATLLGTQAAFTITGTTAVFSFLAFENGSPVDPCRNLPNAIPTDPCRIARAVLSRFLPVDPCRDLPTGSPQDPCRIITPLTTARGTSGTASCAILGAAATPARSGTSVVLNTTARGVFNPFIPNDPCRQLATVPVGFRVSLAANGSITDAEARVGTITPAP
ncbi:MAG TPA: hypothetical protein VN213_18425 [Solirubrobacteraceae bacterium]|nr:hypothetical protein [Solirubrobacteraceae bacterium]